MLIANVTCVECEGRANYTLGRPSLLQTSFRFFYIEKLINVCLESRR